jgi:hypothetical protein
MKINRSLLTLGLLMAAATAPTAESVPLTPKPHKPTFTEQRKVKAHQQRMKKKGR